MELIHPKVTIAQIIEARVRYEVTSYNQSRGQVIPELVKPSAEELRLNGKKFRAFQKVSADEQVAKALNAFQHHRFFMFVNGKQVEALETLISVETPTEVVFVKLFPLVGG